MDGVEYTKGNYTYGVGRSYSVNIWSNAAGDRVDNDYDTWITGRDQNQDSFLEDAEDENITATFETEVKGDIQINDEPDQCRLVIYNYNRDLGHYYNSGVFHIHGEAAIEYQCVDSAGVTYLEGTHYLEDDEMTLQKISMTYFDMYKTDKVEFFNIDDDINTATPFFTATSSNDEYVVPEGTNITEYKAVITGYHGKYFGNYITLARWDSEWNIDTSNLPSYAKPENIREISRYQHSEYVACSAKVDEERSDLTIHDITSADDETIGTVHIDSNKKYYTSFASFELIDYNGKVSTFGETESDKKINISFKPAMNSTQFNQVVRNENPVLYVQLPDEYEYSNFNVTLNGNVNGYLYIKDYNIENIDGVKYLVIQLRGIYKEEYGNVGLTITHDRCLKTQDVQPTLPVKVYMLTDNANYSYGKVVNTYNLRNSKDLSPYYAMELSNVFFISENNHISTTTTILKKIYNIEREYQPGEDKNGRIKKSSKQEPLIFQEGETVKYKSQIEVYDENINNLDFIVRLPKENNTPITTTEYSMDSNLSLSLVDLENIKVEVSSAESGDVFNEISSTDYELLYSTDESATFDSTFQTLDSTVDLSTVKTIRVKFNPNYVVSDNIIVRIIYQMKMPDSVESSDTMKISGATTAVRYTEQNEIETQELESTAAYVGIGNPNGNITLQKKFEGVADGALPLGVSSLAGIQFKLINEYTGEALVLENQTTAEGIIETDANGEIALTDVPEGHYYVEEVTEFDYYEGIDYTDVVVEQGTVSPNPVVVSNKLKRSELTINKTWEGTNTQPYDDNDTITFKITGKDALGFTATKDIDRETGSVTFYGVPYGTYDIEETSGLYGWYLSNEELTIDVLEPTVDFVAENKIAKGTLVITKTMPGEDDVREISLKITGRGISYTDTNGNEVKLDTDMTIKIGDYCDNTDANIHVDLNDSTNPTRATVTISNLPLATYKIEEVAIPKIPESDPEVEMYKPITTRATINENGEVVNVSLANDWKTGNLKIIKTAENGVPLEQFKVKVKLEESKFNTTYEKTFDIPASGELTVEGLYLGKYSVTEVESDYFNPIYDYGEGKTNSSVPVLTEVFDGETSELTIYNQNTYGYVKVLKYLEDKDAENTVGIKFKLSGKDTTGADLTEVDSEGRPVYDEQGNPVLGMTREITPDSIVTVAGKKFGTVLFGPVQAGGEYAIEELNTPEFYREIDPISVDVKKSNDLEHPQIVTIENKRQRGNLEISTKTVPEGGELSPIKYRVREVVLNDNGTFTLGDVIADLDAVAGFAQLTNIYAGTYIVEQTEVPVHYIKDYPQIVEVPDKGIGYVEFEIMKPELKNTYVTVEKEIVNSLGNPATAADFTAAGLSADEIFEVRITNIETQTTYFTFMNTETPGKIKGIPAGTYEIEEVYKPKYLSSAYFIKDGEEYNEIEKINGKILFEVAEPTAGEDASVTLKVRNVINTDFGFAGQDSKNNFSKTTIAEADRVSKTIIYIVDEDGDAVTGAKFKFYYENGEEVPLSFDDNTYEVGTDKRLVINGLPAGKYVIKAISLPEGYLPVEDKEFVAYEGASRVTKIEVLKNKPRGNLTLSTTYTDKDGNKIFTPRSKYKILNSATGKVLRFTKTADGNYVESKLETATDTISLRAGAVTVKGIEIGDYEVGLVDLTEKYGIINEEVEKVTILQDQTVSREVPVKKRYAFKTMATTQSGWDFAVTEDGELYVFASSFAAPDYEIKKFSNYAPSLKDVKVKEIYVKQDGNPNYSSSSYFEAIVIIDDQGRIWTNYYGSEGSSANLTTFTCLNEIEGHPFNGLKFTKATVSTYLQVYAVDDSGKVWFWGNTLNSFEQQLTGKSGIQDVPVLVSRDNILEDVKIVDIDYTQSSGYIIMAVDSDGKVYRWGVASSYSSDGLINAPTDAGIVCVSDEEGNNLKDVKVKSISASYNATTFVADDGNLWICGSSSGYYGNYLGLGDDRDAHENPICLTKLAGNPLEGKKIVYSNTSYNNTFVIDSDGKIWAWGQTGSSISFGGIYNYEESYLNEPKCISDLETSKIKNQKFKMTSDSYYSHTYGIDENGDLWVLVIHDNSSNYSKVPLGRQITYRQGQQKVDFPQNAYFDLFEVQDMSINSKTSLIRDKSGKLWTPGHVNEYIINHGNFELVDYFGSELGASIDSDSVKAYDSGKDSTLLIDDNDKLWTIGFINNAYINKEAVSGYTGREIMDPICVTDIQYIDGNRENALYSKKIKSVTASKGIGSSAGSSGEVAVIDEDGKLYMGGYYNTYTMGFDAQNSGNDYSNHNYAVPFTCINDEYDYLTNVKFTKVAIYDYYVLMAIDENGNLWTWGYYGDVPVENAEYTSYNSSVIKPTLVTIPDNAKIIDVAVSSQGGIAVAEDGKLYVWGSMFGNNGSSSTTPVLAYDELNTILNDKTFVKAEIGFNGSAGIVLDTEGHVYGLMAVRGVLDLSTATQPAEYGNVIAKDIYCGPQVVAIKDIFDDIYVTGTSSSGYNTIGAQSSGRISDNEPNPLYGKTISHQISSNVVSVVENDAETVYVLDSSNGDVISSRVLDSVKAYINTESYTVIFDNENHMYNIARNNVVNLIYPDAIMEKIVYQDDNILLTQDTEGNTYRIAGAIIDKFENVQLSKILYQDENIMIMNDVNGDLYKINSVAFKKLEGFDEGTEIESIWADRMSYTQSVSGHTYTSEADIIYFQDSNNGLWVIMQSPDGNGEIDSRWIKMSGIDGVTAEQLKTAQKITGYTGNKIQKMYIDPYAYKREVACIDSDNNLWMWTAYPSYEFMDGTPKIILENVVEYETAYSTAIGYGGYGHLVLDGDGNLYSFGYSYRSFNQETSKYVIIGSPDSLDELSLVNLSVDYGIGKIKLFYLNKNDAIAVNEDNEIYALLYGAQPIRFDARNVGGIEVSYNDIEEIYGYNNTASTFYGDTFYATKKNDDTTEYCFTIKSYYREATVSTSSSTSERNIDELKDKGSNGGEILNQDPNSSEITSSISTTYTGTTGLVVQDDNKLYFVDTTSSTCITDKAGQVDVFGKQFKVIRDSKYND